MVFYLFYNSNKTYLFKKIKNQDFSKSNSKYTFQINKNIDFGYKLLNKKHGHHLQIVLLRLLKKTKFQFYFFIFRTGK